MHWRARAGIGPAAGAVERLMGWARYRFGVEVRIGVRALTRFAPDGQFIFQIYGSSF
jgi:hypothetical protein